MYIFKGIQLSINKEFMSLRWTLFLTNSQSTKHQNTIKYSISPEPAPLTLPSMEQLSWVMVLCQ